MKARELVELIQKHDPEADIYIQQADSRGWSPIDGIKVHRQTNWSHKTKDVVTDTYIIIEEKRL